jgi:DNA-binding transcriptional LysR family regulator
MGSGEMDLTAMEVFARVVEARSFSGAARRLGVSKSVVSKHITRIEKRLGVRLLNRTTRRLSLTEVGAAFYERCAQIVSQAEEAELIATRSHSEPRGLLKVNVPVAFGVRHIAPALAEFSAPHAELRIDMTFNDRSVDLAEEGYDVVVQIANRLDGAFISRRLAPIHRIVCATPEYWSRHRKPETPDDLVHHNCLAYTYLNVQNEWCFAAEGAEMRVPISGNLRVNNENALWRAALGGLGVALLPTFIAGEDLQSGALEAALTGYAVPANTVYAIYLPNRHLSAKVRAFIDFFVQRFAPEPYWDQR